MEQLVIKKLKQHTPMWHFQSDEKGCCLRASEVKPKLDRFIAAREGRKYQPLDYKMYFEAKGEKQILPDTYTRHDYKNNTEKEYPNFPIYFGNMKEKTKELVFYEDVIEMRFFSLDTKLLQTITKHLPAFFASTSFGTRQDKGFGFFYLADEAKFDSSGASYEFDVPAPQRKGQFEKQKNLFDYILAFHKMIRSGVNFPNRKNPKQAIYYKSFMFHYAKGKETNWDKPIIRHHFQLYNNVYKSLCDEPISNPRDAQKMAQMFPVQKEMKKAYPELQALRRKDYAGSRRMFRDALGLAGIQEWVAYRDTITTEGRNGTMEIKRFKSPVTYRPVPKPDGGFKVYLYLSPIPDAYKKADFTIKNSRGREMTGMKIYEDFSLENYFDFIIDYCNGTGLKAGTERKDPCVEYLFAKKNGRVNFRKTE